MQVACFKWLSRKAGLSARENPAYRFIRHVFCHNSYIILRSFVQSVESTQFSTASSLPNEEA